MLAVHPDKHIANPSLSVRAAAREAAVTLGEVRDELLATGLASSLPDPPFVLDLSATHPYDNAVLSLVCLMALLVLCLRSMPPEPRVAAAGCAEQTEASAIWQGKKRSAAAGRQASLTRQYARSKSNQVSPLAAAELELSCDTFSSRQLWKLLNIWLGPNKDHPRKMLHRPYIILKMSVFLLCATLN